jgi:hypothetical protein
MAKSKDDSFDANVEMAELLKKSPNDVPIDRSLIDYISKDKQLPPFDREDPNCRNIEHSISLRVDGWSNSEIASGLGLSKSTMLIWEKQNKLYAACIDFIKALEADEGEQRLWQHLMRQKTPDISTYFALKGRKPEYRDNAPMPTTNTINLRISLDGKQLQIQGTQEMIEAGSDDDLEV